jgi:hypothetical protein
MIIYIIVVEGLNARLGSKIFFFWPNLAFDLLWNCVRAVDHTFHLERLEDHVHTFCYQRKTSKFMCNAVNTFTKEN